MEVTKEFVVAVEAGAEALLSAAGALLLSEHMKAENEVGKALRQGVERNFQTVDLLRGWTKRAREAVGLAPVDW